MLYAEYRSKMEKILSAINKILKFRVLIISVLAVIFAAVTALLILKGNVSDVSACSESFIFGEEIDYSANAFLSSVSYEYRKAGETNWSGSLPRHIGKFEVRAVAMGSFSVKKYGKIYEFEVLPREVELDFESDSVIYGDMPKLTGDLAYDDVAVCLDYEHGDLTAPSAEFTPKLQETRIINESGQDVTDCYVLSVVTKDLQILKRRIKLTTPSPAPYVYDGAAHTAREEFYIGDGTLAFEDTILAEDFPTLIMAASVPIEPTFTFINSEGNDVTHKYDIILSAGTLTVEKRAIKVTTGSARKLYDGTDLNNSNYLISPDTPLVEGQTETIIGAPSIKNVGEINNIISFGVFDGEEDVSSNYNFVIEAGKLTVTPRRITVTSGTPEAKVYDGMPFSYLSYTVSGDELADGQNFAVSSYAALTDAGMIPNEIVLMVTDGQNDITSNYSFTYEYGELRVLKRSVTIVTNDNSWIYDGADHFDLTYRYHDSSPYTMCDGETLEATNNVIVKNVCLNVENEVYYSAFKNGVYVNQENYEITVLYGHLSVFPREVSLRTLSATWVYDSLPHSENGFYIASATGVAAGQELRAESLSFITSVGTMENELAFTVYDSGENVTSNYSFSVENGVLTVIKRVVKVVSMDGGWDFDGAAHEMPEYYVAEDSPKGFIEGDVISASGFSKITNVGTCPNEFDLTVISSGVDVTQSCYIIVKEFGTLEIYPASVEIYVYELSKVYDGAPLSYTNDQYEVGALPDGFSVTVVLPDSSVTSCGSVSSEEVRLATKVYVYNALSENVNAYFHIDIQGGGITVNRANLIIVADSAEKFYDGEELTCPSFSLRQGSLPVGFYIEATVEGSIIDVGEVDNIITSYSVYDANGNDVTSNYNVTTEIGKLKVL